MKAKPSAIILGSYIHSLVNFRRNLIEDLIKRGYSVLALAPSYDQEIVRILNNLGAEFHSVPLARTGLNPWADLKTFFFLFRFFRKNKPDVLISYTIKPVIYGTAAATLAGGIKTIALITGLGYLDTDPGSFVKRLMKTVIHSLYRGSLRKLDYIAFQNSDDRAYFETNGLLAHRTRVTITAGSGVDMQVFQRAQPVLHPVTFLFIARLIRAKGIIQYIDAARQLHKLFGDRVACQVVGLPDENNPDSIDENFLQPYVADGSIAYLGYQKDVRPVLKNCSVFVLPSYYREGTPRTILEALAMGKPIITTDNPGCRDTVQNGVNGFMIPIKDTLALFTAMEKFVNNTAMIPEMGEQSFALVQQRYDVRLVNAHLLAFADL